VFWVLFIVLLSPCFQLYVLLQLPLQKHIAEIQDKIAETHYFFASPQVKLKHELDQHKFEHVLEYVREGADINTLDSHGHSALDITFIPRYSGYLKRQNINPEQVKIALLLLNKGITVSSPQNVLRAAAQTGSTELVGELLKKGVNINKSIKRNHTYSIFCINNPLSVTAETGNNQMVEFLLKQGAHVNGEDDKLSCSPLLQAIKNKHSDTAMLLIQKGADVNSVDGYGFTPLMEASHASDELYETLIQHGANIHAATPYGHTVVTESALGNEQKLKILFKYLKPKGNVIIIQPSVNTVPWDSVTGKSLQQN
jgi:ankyrin repeat protein